MTVEDKFQNTLYDKLVLEPFKYNDEFEKIPKIYRDLSKLVLPITFHFNMDKQCKRDEIQKSVYIAQRFWKDLGFRFGAHQCSIWSERLFKDLLKSYEFYCDNDAHKVTSYVICNLTKIDVIKAQIVRKFLSSPIEFNRYHWINTLTYMHYLINVCNYSIDGTKNKLKDSKLYIEKAMDRIEEFEKYDMDRVI